jgi:diguanylate cyclase (GGDEF)-like protein
MNILVVDDNKLIRKMVAAMIRAADHQAIMADGHSQAMQALQQNKVDLILMDIEMPEINGFELTRLIRQQQPNWIPIIFLSANDSAEHLAQGIDAGGDDYLTKPVTEVILNAKIRAMARIADMQQALDEANKKLKILSNVDPLTQILNRRGLEALLLEAWQSCSAQQEQQTELSLLMLDIDFFKPYNDNYGHPQGDDCLKRVAAILSQCLHRSSDFVARYGGEEFILVLPDTQLQQAKSLSEKIIYAFDQAQLKHEHSKVADFISVSIGISSSRLAAVDHHQLIQQADQALYQAKKTGRKRSVVFNPSDTH